MEVQIDLLQAVALSLGPQLRPTYEPINDWQLFTPFLHGQTGQVRLFRLLELPSHFQTSQEVQARARADYGGLLHQVTIIPVQRGYWTSYYLLEAAQNVISVESLIRLKRETSQHMPEPTILKFIEFCTLLQAHKRHHQIHFDMQGVSTIGEDEFLLTNYQLYFVSDNKTEARDSLSLSMRKVLAKMLVPSVEGIDFVEIYSQVEEVYGPRVLSLVQKLMGEQFKASEAYSIMFEPFNALQTTLTDSFHSSHVPSEEHHPQLHDDSLSVHLLAAPQAKPRKSTRLPLLVVAFLLIMCGIGLITFKYLTPRPVLCSDNEYLDQQLARCLSCDPSCNRCQGGNSDKCLACGESKYLIKRSKGERVGRCALECQGTKVGTGICIDNTI